MSQSFFKFVKGILLRPEASDPTDNLEGSAWYNSALDRFRGYAESAVRTFVMEDQAQTLTNKTISGGTVSGGTTITGATFNADSNTLTNIDNNEIKAAAAIDLTKLAATTANSALVSDASGFIVPSAVTSTELGYVSGVTSALQTQINGKEPTITVLGETRGGTGQSTYTTGDTLYASAANTLSKRAIGTAGQVLTVTGGVPTWETPSGGASGFSVTTISSNVTLTDLTIHLVDTTAARSLTLPTPVNGIQIIVKDKSGNASVNAITIVRAGSELIDGVAASRVMSTNWESLNFVSDGVDWFIAF